MSRRWGRGRWLELGLLAAILLLAAAVRLPGLDQRGQWDSDQGRDMGAVQSMVTGGPIPLLGPSTSIGGLHHGALYEYLLAPVAAVSGSDPVAAMGAVALAGVATVAAIAWLAWLLGGSAAGLIAGLFAAVSPSLIGASVTLWEPSLIPLASAVGFAGILQARRSGQVRWWLVAGLGVSAAMQLHVLDVLLAIPLVWAWADDLARRRRTGLPTGGVLRGGLGALVVILLGYLPLALHEVTGGFSETRSLLAYLGSGGGGAAQAGIAERLIMVVLRTLTWPFAGLVTDRPALSLATLVVVVVLIGAALALTRSERVPEAGAGDDAAGAASASKRRESFPEAHAGDDAVAPARWPVAWLTATLAVSAVVLVFAAPSLAVVTPGLPNDHYHAFLDPIVIALAAVGAARLAARGLRLVQVSLVFWRGAAAVLVAMLVAVGVIAWPPAVSPDGGWRLADATAAHIADTVNAGWPPEEPRLLVSLPAFKPDDAMRFPLARRGLVLQPPIVGQPASGTLPVGVVVIVCDPLFDDATGIPCDGPAEDVWMASAYAPGSMQLVNRIDAGARRTISIYAPSRLARVAGAR